MMRESLRQRVAALIARPHGDIAAEEVSALALEVSRWQRAASVVVGRVAEATLDGGDVASIDEIPAVPTDVFKSARVACFDEDRTVRTFLTSGTTRDTRGAHAFDDLSVYECAALSAARRWLLPRVRYRFVLLAADEREAPESSLSYMLARFVAAWGDSDEAFCVRGGALDEGRVRARIASARDEGIPVALLGASYGFVHLADALDASALALPPTSVVMPTGGFKGRSRELDPVALGAMLRGTFGVSASQIVGEYGMTELSSQAYEAHVEGSARFRSPPWMRVSAVDPESLAPLPEGEVGLLRVVDLANLGSSIAVQTSDLGRVYSDGFEVLGRAPGATPRGCARALDAVLSGDS